MVEGGKKIQFNYANVELIESWDTLFLLKGGT